VIGFAALRRRTAISEHPPTEDAAARARTADEFAQAEAYEEQWHAENKGRDSARRFP
jgi:hypothetical protein